MGRYRQVRSSRHSIRPWRPFGGLFVIRLRKSSPPRRQPETRTRTDIALRRNRVQRPAESRTHKRSASVSTAMMANKPTAPDRFSRDMISSPIGTRCRPQRPTGRLQKWSCPVRLPVPQSGWRSIIGNKKCATWPLESPESDDCAFNLQSFPCPLMRPVPKAQAFSLSMCY